MDKVLPYIQAFAIPALAAAGGLIAYLFNKQQKRDEVREKLRAEQEQVREKRRMELEEIEHKRRMAEALLTAWRQNSSDAVKAVEQLYPNLPGPEKAKLAAERADRLNEVLGEKPTATNLQTWNESNVLKLDEKPKGEG